LVSLALATADLFYVVSILRYRGMLPLGIFGDLKPAQIAGLVDMVVITLAMVGRRWMVERDALRAARDAEGKAVGVAMDMTSELRRNKERLEVALEAEQVVSERKQQFLSMLSHEYRNPLAVIEGSLDLLELEGRDLRNKDEMTRMREAVQRLKSVMEASLERSRFMDCKHGEFFRAVAIDEFVLRQVDNVRWMWPEVRISLTCRCDGCAVYGDPQLLGVLMFNLLDNARKYAVPDTPLMVACGLEGSIAQISVSNRCASRPLFGDSSPF
jgi:signal transduction histidine kinase